ncbi:MAG: tungstate transport system substrate-binding protein [Candidatus Petromonas sp.]|nr:tungstate transport system substrate-binding protein [Candidatus Petromonas sp.]
MSLRDKKFISIVLLLAVSLLTFAGCTQNTSKETNKSKSNGSIILATTTSTENSGLLDYILPYFKKEAGIDVKVVAVGTGKALQMGRDGEVDVLLVHAKDSEEKFVAEGHGIKRYDVMYNDFVLIGPKDDPAQIEKNAKNDILKAFNLLNKDEYKFVSRGDDSGTHKKEKNFWQEIDIKPEGDWYISAGKGMGDVIQMADELLAYTMSDRATYLSMKDKIDLEILVEGDPRLFNQYGVIPVNPDKNENINSEGANAFAEWILSDKTQKLIGEFGKEKFGQALFIPNAK